MTSIGGNRLRCPSNGFFTDDGEVRALAGRNARRKNRTRSALITAAQQILAGGDGADVSVQAITDLADVGLGSFYNHFDSKGELFSAASSDAFGQYRVWLDERLGDERDPIRLLTMSIRLSGRLGVPPRPGTGSDPPRGASSPGTEGLAPDVVEHLVAAVSSSRVSADDPDVAVVSAAGAIAAVLRVTVKCEPAEQVRLSDAAARNVLRMFGTDEKLIAELLALPLPLAARSIAGAEPRSLAGP